MPEAEKTTKIKRFMCKYNALGWYAAVVATANTLCLLHTYR